jgi:hypothetical protein
VGEQAILVLESREGQHHQEDTEEEGPERRVREYDQPVVVRAVPEQEHE